jgi:DNA primase
MARSRIPAATIERIRSRVDLVRLVEEAGVTLRRSGKNYIGRCPFHQDDSPSFSVSAERQLYHCFGCGASGTVFTFLARREGIPFEETVQRLAARAGVSLDEVKGGPLSPEEDQVVAACRFAREFFHERLVRDERGRSAREYLAARGVREETVREFRLGYAPDEWDVLLRAMRGNGFHAQVLVLAGLVREREGGGHYDYFRNRVIFPILDVQGEVVAFGGRALDDDATPKYLNSPDTPLYHKSDVLYLLHHARPAIREEGRVLVAEGYLDALIPYQEGIRNVVASLGTALSESHARLLRRTTDEVVFLFDGDAAGTRAVLRGAPAFLREGFRVKVAVLPAGTDPDSFVRREGAAALAHRVAESVHLVEFQIRALAREQDLSGPDGKLSVIRQVAELLRQIPSPVLLREYSRRLATELDVHPKDVWTELRRAGVAFRTPPPEEPAERGRRVGTRVRKERRLLSCLLASPENVLRVFEQLTPADFTEPAHREVARLLWLNAREADRTDSYLLMDTCYDEDVRALMATLLLEARPLPHIEEEVDGWVKELAIDTLRELERQHLATHAEGGRAEDPALAKTLADLARERRKLEKN